MHTTSNFARRAFGVVLTSLALAACSDELLDVNNPDVIEPEKLETAQGATTLYAGALADFAQAHDGSSDGSAQGLFGGVPFLKFNREQAAAILVENGDEVSAIGKIDLIQDRLCFIGLAFAPQ